MDSHPVMARAEASLSERRIKCHVLSTRGMREEKIFGGRGSGGSYVASEDRSVGKEMGDQIMSQVVVLSACDGPRKSPIYLGPH